MNTFAEDIHCSFGGTNTFLHVHGTSNTQAFDVFECMDVASSRLILWRLYYANEAQKLF